MRKYFNMTLKRFALAAGFGITALASTALFSGQAAKADGSAVQPKAVVEMFTSQGCSSCPAADEILAKYADRNDLLALSWHVDYWNYLGWKDTFSSPQFSERQRLYAKAFRRTGVYTPQAVINGRDHAVGSRESDIKGLMRRFEARGQGLVVPIAAKREGDEIRIKAGGGKPVPGDATLWIVFYDESRSVKIQRGENSGRTITYRNVVRDIAMLGMMKQGPLDVTLDLADLRRRGYESCAVILQKKKRDGSPGAIIGAAVIGNISGS